MRIILDLVKLSKISFIVLSREMESERIRIKKKIMSLNSGRWWGDDFDVRFYLISKLKTIKNKSILDVGGGIGVIVSEVDKTNLRINLDYSFDDLKICKDKTDSQIHNICASMTNLPFRDKFFDYVICSHILEIAKEHDVSKHSSNGKVDGRYPTVGKILQEIHHVLKSEGKLYVTTPNNAYYKTNKLTYDELKDSILSVFSFTKIFFYNTYPKMSKNHRRFNMANVLPKLRSKLSNDEYIIKSLIKTTSKNNYSVSFFVEVKR